MRLTQRSRTPQFIGLIIDESTDVAIYKKLIIHNRYITSSCDAAVAYVENIIMPEGTADIITNV